MTGMNDLAYLLGGHIKGGQSRAKSHVDLNNGIRMSSNLIIY